MCKEDNRKKNKIKFLSERKRERDGNKKRKMKREGAKNCGKCHKFHLIINNVIP